MLKEDTGGSLRTVDSPFVYDLNLLSILFNGIG